MVMEAKTIRLYVLVVLISALALLILKRQVTELKEQCIFAHTEISKLLSDTATSFDHEVTLLGAQGDLECEGNHCNYRVTEQPKVAGVSAVPAPVLEEVNGALKCRGVDCILTSQNQEDYDFMLKYLMKDPRPDTGVVVELGGNDGVTYSNSYSLYLNLGWKTVLFEPSRVAYSKMRDNRPDAVNFNLAACETLGGQVTMVEDPGLSLVSGVETEMSSSFASQWHSAPHQADRYTVPCGPIGHFLKIIGLDHVDLFSIDVEGGELYVLRSIDFKAIDVHYVLIEMDEHDLEKNRKCRDILVENGFKSRGIIGKGYNEFFEKESYSH